MPNRIQRRRTKGWKMPENCVYIGRPSRYGNPFFVGGEFVTFEDELVSPKNVEECLHYYRKHLEWVVKSEWMHHKYDFLSPLRGKDVCCWCADGKPCHGDILLEFIELTS